MDLAARPAAPSGPLAKGVTVIFLLVGLGVFLYGVAVLEKAWQSRDWPSVFGKAVSAKVVGTHKRRRPQIRYAYAVANRTYTGNRILIGPGPGTGGLGIAGPRHYVRKYAKSRMVAVFFDPEDPANAVLEPGIHRVVPLIFLVGIFFSLSEFSARFDAASQAVGYDKGAMVFHMLRKRIGEASFWETLRKIAVERRFQAAGWRDLQRGFEQAAGIDLSGFFDQWVFRRGAPRLRLDRVRAEPADGLWRIRGELVQTPPYFDLKAELGLHGLCPQGLRGPRPRLSRFFPFLRGPARVGYGDGPAKPGIYGRNGRRRCHIGGGVGKIFVPAGRGAIFRPACPVLFPRCSKWRS